MQKISFFESFQKSWEAQRWEGLTYFLDCSSTSNWRCAGQKRCEACREWLQFLVVEARHWLWGAGHPRTPILLLTCFSFVGAGASRCPWNSPVFQESGAIYLEGALVPNMRHLSKESRFSESKCWPLFPKIRSMIRSPFLNVWGHYQFFQTEPMTAISWLFEDNQFSAL